MGVLNIVTHNSSYKGHKPLVETNLPLPPPCRHHRDRMIVGFTTTYTISAYHH